MKLLEFNFNSYSIRTILIDGEPWFVLKDIGAVLELSNHKQALIDLKKRLRKGGVSDEVSSTYPIKDSMGREQKVTIVSETGLYELVFASRKDIAIEFRFWVTSEVLPSIRKTGSYSLPTKPKEDIDIESIRKRTELIVSSKDQFIAFEDVFYRIGITRKEELAITSNRAVAKETGVDFIELAELKGVSTPHKYFTVTELCQKVMNSDKFDDEAKKLVSTKKGDKPRPQNLNKLFETNGFQTKIDGIWKPTEKAKDLADFVQNKSKHSEKTVFHTVWKMEVLDRII